MREETSCVCGRKHDETTPVRLSCEHGDGKRRGARVGPGFDVAQLSFPGMQIEQAKCPMPPVRRQSELLKARG
jgi:hypothetical protein